MLCTLKLFRKHGGNKNTKRLTVKLHAARRGLQEKKNTHTCRSTLRQAVGFQEHDLCSASAPHSSSMPYFVRVFYNVRTQATVCIIYYTPPSRATQRGTERRSRWLEDRAGCQIITPRNDSLRLDTITRHCVVVVFFIIILSIFIIQHMTYRKH